MHGHGHGHGHGRHRFHPRMMHGDWRYSSGYGGFYDVADPTVVVWRPDLIFIDPTLGTIGCCTGGEAYVLNKTQSAQVMTGWFGSHLYHAAANAIGDGAKTIGKQAAKGLGAASHAVSAVTHAPADLALHGLAAATSLVNKDAGKWVGKGADFVRDQGKIGDQAIGGALRDIGNGKSVQEAFTSSGHVLQKELKDVGPYAQMVMSMVPGVGTAASGALGTGIALANGKSITQAAIDGLAGAVPGGAAGQIAYKLAQNMVAGKNVLESAMSAARSQLPKEAQAAFDTGLALAKGKSVQEAFTAGVKQILPKEAQAAFDAGRDILAGRVPSMKTVEAFGVALPPEASVALNAVTKIAQGKNVLDVAKDVAMSPALGLDENARKEIAMALTAAHGHSLSEAAKTLALDAMPPELRKDAEIALAAVAAGHAGGAEGLVRTLIAKGAPPEAAAALAAVDALRSGDPAGAAKKVAKLMGGDLPPAAAQLLSTASAIASGQSPVEVAKHTLRGMMPPDARAGADVALAILDGKGPAEAIRLAPQLAAQLGLPPEMMKYAQVAINAAHSSNPVAALAQTAEIAALQAFPPQLRGDAEAAVAMVMGGTPLPSTGDAASIARGLQAMVTGLLGKGAPRELVASLAAAVALSSGDPRQAAKLVAQAFGGDLPPAAAKLLSMATALMSGGSPTQMAKTAILGMMPPSTSAMAETALRALEGKSPAEAMKLIPGIAAQLGLPPDAVAAAQASINAATGRDPTSAALAVLRRSLPPSVAAAFDASVASGRSDRPAIVAQVRKSVERSDLEGAALTALRQYGFDPRKVTMADIASQKGLVTLPKDVLLQVPEIKHASDLVVAAKAGNPQAQAALAEMERHAASGDVEAAKRHQSVQVAREAHDKGAVTIRRGMRAAEIQSMIDMARRASAA